MQTTQYETITIPVREIRKGDRYGIGGSGWTALTDASDEGDHTAVDVSYEPDGGISTRQWDWSEHQIEVGRPIEAASHETCAYAKHDSTPESVTCGSCKGEGTVEGTNWEDVPCDECYGTGEIEDPDAQQEDTSSKTFEIRITISGKKRIEQVSDMLNAAGDHNLLVEIERLIGNRLRADDPREYIVMDEVRYGCSSSEEILNSILVAEG